VGCYTCHRGDLAPLSIPILPSVERSELNEEQKPSALPSADEILSKYTQALGSEQAISKVTSRLTTATEDLPTGPGGRTTAQASLEQCAKASNLQTGSGVKFPFVIRMLPGTSAAAPAGQSTIQVENVQENVPIDDGTFAKPHSKIPVP
jgi:hypothetical protein